ncbi:MAG: iron-containing redox enzyme family protein [Phormidium sp.]
MAYQFFIIGEYMIWREIYRRVLNPEVFLDNNYIDELRSDQIESFSEEHCVDDFSKSLSFVRKWAVDQQQMFQNLWDASEGDLSRRRLTETLLIQSTPLASTLSCWLQGMTAPGVFEDETQLALLSLLADDVGAGRPHASRGSEFHLLLERHGLSASAVSPTALFANRNIDDVMYALPATLFAMSRRSDFFDIEICAVDVVFRTVGILPCWAILKNQCEQWINWGRLDLGISGNPSIVADPLVSSMQIADHYRSLNREIAQRFDRGVQWIILALDKWNRYLWDRCRASTDKDQAMAKLVREKAREASVYHKSYLVEGCPLSHYFQKGVLDPFPLMAALSKSPFVKAGNSGKSALVNQLVSLHGPMFRVFRSDELKTIREWIDGLSVSQTEEDLCSEVGGAVVENAPRTQAAKSGDLEIGRRPTNIREAYFLLQGRALAPQTRGFAVEYVTRWLTSARRAASDSGRGLPNLWPLQGLRDWLLDQHDLHGQTFEENRGNSLPTKAEVIDSTLQLAPLILIDGSWLQGFTDICLASSSFGYLLFDIYWDELGNGQIELNHPKIYRDLLNSMGINLAPTGSWDFANDIRIKNDSFRLPVYWLCLGKLPLTFRPEILGMNLAMELSGVGDGYRLARRFLQEYGFSTQFVDLHNAIDNIATGHSAWASDAIDTYMTMVAESGNEKQVVVEWERIKTGYKSLSSIPSRTQRWITDLMMSIQFKQLKTSTAPTDSLHHELSI